MEETGPDRMEESRSPKEPKEPKAKHKVKKVFKKSKRRTEKENRGTMKSPRHFKMMWFANVRLTCTISLKFRNPPRPTAAFVYLCVPEDSGLTSVTGNGEQPDEAEGSEEISTEAETSPSPLHMGPGSRPADLKEPKLHVTSFTKPTAEVRPQFYTCKYATIC